ncbi:TetR/AcrR family transcriptional regulator [Pseudomonas aeruginosa]|nr:TetR/AcrR family transcriptional regulator [Pseudomonas aeruginosa]
MSTRSELLTSAESMLRTKGYAAFSYADLAEAIGIKKASIHHHFPTKETLGITIVESNLFRFTKQLEKVDSDLQSAVLRLEKYAGFFLESSESSMLPLCGALAAEISVLPDSLKALTKKYFEVQLAWVESNIVIGQKQGEFRPELDGSKIARTLLNLLEGGSFVAWALDDKSNSNFGFEFFMNNIVVKKQKPLLVLPQRKASTSTRTPSCTETQASAAQPLVPSHDSPEQVLPKGRGD